MNFLNSLSVQMAILLLAAFFFYSFVCRRMQLEFNLSDGFTLWGDIVMGLLAFVMVSGCWLIEIRKSQFAPHLITSHIGATVICQNWVTNPAYVSFEYVTVPGSNGLEIIAKPVTNYYWHQWAIFK